MKFLVVLLFSLMLITPVYAEESNLPMLVTDIDPKGTNVRESPGGKVIKVIPFGGKTDQEKELRRVVVTGQNKEWFRVRLSDDSQGWMHRSVLGTCTSATEDGNPSLHKKPDYNSGVVATIKSDLPVDLLAVKGNWVKVQGKGGKPVGWLPEQAIFSNVFNDCRNPATSE